MDAARPAPEAARPHVLIVEDEPQLRRVLVRVMHADGYAVVEADSLARACELLAATEIAVAVLDVSLPDGDGLSLLPLLPREAALIVTANPDARVLARAEGRRVLAKPLDLRELRCIVRSLASRGGPRPSPPDAGCH